MGRVETLLARAKTVFLRVRGKQRPRVWESLWSHTGRRVPTGDGVSCARKWAEADWGCGFPHRWWQSLWSQMSGSAAVNVTGDRAPHAAGGLGGVLGARVAPQHLVHGMGKASPQPGWAMTKAGSVPVVLGLVTAGNSAQLPGWVLVGGGCLCEGQSLPRSPGRWVPSKCAGPFLGQGPE